MPLAVGLDISLYQPHIDWTKLIAATGVSFVMVRAGDGNFVDPVFAQHWQEARQAGLLRGAYHFLRQSVDAHTQAQLFLQALAADPGELPPVLDIEDTRVTSPAAYAAAAQQWLHEVEAGLPSHPILYTGAWWWNPNMLIAGRYPDWAPGYPLWVASYPLRSSVPSQAQLEQGQFSPILPKSWSAWTYWQYSGDVAFPDGITDANGNPCHADLDVFNGTLDQLRAQAQAAVPAPAGSPATQPPAVQPAPPSTPPAAAGVSLPDPRVTNQVMINAFSRAFGAGYWDVVLRAGLGSLADQRQAEYSGPAIQALTSLSAAEQAALGQVLAQILTGPFVTPP